MLSPITMLVLIVMVLSLLLVCFPALRYHIKTTVRIWMFARKVPGPVLTFRDLIALSNLTTVFHISLKWIDSYGPVFRVWFGPSLFVVLSDPEDVQQVFTNKNITQRDPLSSITLLKFFREGIMSSNVKSYKIHRRLVSPAVGSSLSESSVQMFGDKAAMLAAILDDIADGRLVDVERRMELYLFDVTCQFVHGVNMNAQMNESAAEILDTLQSTMKHVANCMENPAQWINWIYPITSEGRKITECIKRLDDIFKPLVSERLEAHRSGTISHVSEGDMITTFLDKLVKSSERAGGLLTEAEIAEDLTAIIGAGIDTTSKTLCFTLLLLAMHPEYQTRIQDELDIIFQDKAEPDVKLADLSKMTLLDNAIKESLRLFPPALLLTRLLTEDIVLPSGLVLPEGCSVIAHSYAIQRDARNYTQPNLFMPERWTQENDVNRSRHAFLPFGVGPRTCVGQKVAMLQLKTVLSCLLRRFRFVDNSRRTMEELSEQIELSVFIRCSEGFKMKIYRRCDREQNSEILIT